MLFVIAAEVRRIFITDAKAGARSVEIFAEHETSSFLQPDLFLILKRAHRRHGFKVMVKSRNAHPQLACDVVDPKRPCVVLA